jgi:hypothetical protein
MEDILFCHSGINLKKAFNGEMAYGALFVDYLGIWILSLGFMPNSKECVNAEMVLWCCSIS